MRKTDMSDSQWLAVLARKAKRRGKHRIKRERAPLPGMMVHQDASTHRWCVLPWRRPS